MKINAGRLLNWTLREIGTEDSQALVDLYFERESLRLMAAVTDKGRYEIKGGVFRHGELLACTAAAPQEKAAGEISYRQLLGSLVYDEEGDVSGAIGDVRLDIDNLRASDVDLSGGVLADLAFGRKRVSVEHLKDMLVELEGEE